PELEGMAAGGGELLGQNLAGGDAHLPADEVDSRYLLGDGVFDLDARIGFHEDDRAVLTEEELARGGADVADMGEQSRRRLGDDALLVGRQERCRGLLDDLLIATLQSAVTGRHDADIAV